MPKQKGVNNISSNHLTRLKKYQDYFDQEKTYYMTPHARSLPKKKPFFNQQSFHLNNNQNGNKQNARSKQKVSAKKTRKSINQTTHVVNFNKKRQDRVKDGSPSFSRQKPSRYDHSIQKEYDSPSKQNEELDFILADRPRNSKQHKKNNADTFIQKTIDAVYKQLTSNHLSQSIEMLEQALKRQPSNYDLNYLLGVCHLINGSYDEAIYIFNGLLNRKSRKNIYLLLSVCFKKKEDYEETQKILNQCIRTNSKSYEAFIYRGKLYLRLKKYKQALQDFQKAIKLNPDKQIAYIGKGDSLRLTERFEQAKAIYMKALHMTKKPNPSILLRKAICNMELKRYNPAFDDIEILLGLDPENSQALYFKGLIFNKQKLQNQAIICYEQAIKFNTNKKAVTRSIYELTKIKIEHRDYYEALYTIERATYLDIEEKVIRKFKIFTQGATEMMKKNFQSGIEILSELIEEDKEKPIGSFLKPLIYSCRSYGYMSLGKFQQARDDLDKIQNDFSLDIPNLYNKFICQGIISCNQQKYQQSLAFFSKANKILPSRIEPYFYKAVTLISFISKLIPKQFVEKQQEYLQSALKTVHKCQKSLDSNHSLYLLKAFLYYASGDLQKSLDNLEQSMKQPIKWQSFVFYLNGLILGQWGKYEEAIDEFNKVINFSNSDDHKESKEIIPEVYLNKARCLLLSNQVNAAFVDLQQYMSFRPSSPEIHIWAGHMLYSIGAAEDAAKAYSNINNINKNPEVLMYRTKCQLSSKDVISTLSSLKLILQAKYDNKIFFDFNILEALRECSDEQAVNYEQILSKLKQTKQRAISTGEGVFGVLFKEIDYQFYKGVLYFYMKDYEKAIKNFKRSLKLMEEYVAENVERNQDLLDFYRLSYNNLLYNYAECQYNIALAHLMGGNIPRGINTLKSIIEKCDGEERTHQEIQLFIHLLQKQLTSQFDRKPEKSDNDEAAELFPFPYENRLCSIFPDFIIPLSSPIQTRLFFCLPRVDKPDLRPKFDSKLFDDINMSIIDIRPEAPWIRRSQEGVIFTDDVIGCEIQLSELKSSSSSSQQEEEHQNYDDDDENEEMDNASEGNAVPQVMDPGRLRDFLRLDPETEARLAKIPKN